MGISTANLSMRRILCITTTITVARSNALWDRILIASQIVAESSTGCHMARDASIQSLIQSNFSLHLCPIFSLEGFAAMDSPKL
jgi:hypothetical protein